MIKGIARTSACLFLLIILSVIALNEASYADGTITVQKVTVPAGFGNFDFEQVRGDLVAQQRCTDDVRQILFSELLSGDVHRNRHPARLRRAQRQDSYCVWLRAFHWWTRRPLRRRETGGDRDTDVRWANSQTSATHP